MNAKIFTGNPSSPWAEALASRGGRITAIGREKDVERRAGPRTDVLDADDRLVLPGFIDSHVHLIWGYELGTWIDLTGRPSLDETLQRVKDYAYAHPEEEILIGHGFDYAALTPAGLPQKEDLDAAVSDRPVVLTAWDGHTGWGNSQFTERARRIVEKAGRDIGEMQLDPRTGQPTGIFHRTFDLTQRMPEMARRRSVEGLRRTVAMASRYGITSALDVQVNLDDLHAYVKLRDSGGLTVRMNLAIYHPETMHADAYPQLVATREAFRDDNLCVSAVKLYIDGVQETGTAALLEPYANDPASRGSTVYAPDAYETIVAKLDRLGLQVCTHACGDWGVRIALETYEAVARRNRTSGRRHRIEHCENLAPEDMPRFRRLGVIPCMMPRHAAPELTGRWREAIGPERTRIAFPWRGLLDAGANLAFASDWPVADLNPLVGIHEAVNRHAHDGTLSPHRISLEEAIHAYTLSGAFACHTESTRGSLEKGKYADFVLLSENLFEIPVEAIHDAHVERTVVGGRPVFAAARGSTDLLP